MNVSDIQALNAPDAWKHVLIERLRQQEGEGYTLEHDDRHSGGELLASALCYGELVMDRAWSIPSEGLEQYQESFPESFWPWEEEAWRPKNPRHDLVKAAALILAEIERLDRADNEVKHGR